MGAHQSIRRREGGREGGPPGSPPATLAHAVDALVLREGDGREAQAHLGDEPPRHLLEQRRLEEVSHVQLVEYLHAQLLGQAYAVRCEGVCF